MQVNFTWLLAKYGKRNTRDISSRRWCLPEMRRMGLKVDASPINLFYSGNFYFFFSTLQSKLHLSHENIHPQLDYQNLAQNNLVNYMMEFNIIFHWLKERCRSHLPLLYSLLKLILYTFPDDMNVSTCGSAKRPFLNPIQCLLQLFSATSTNNQAVTVISIQRRMICNPSIRQLSSAYPLAIGN